MAAHGAVVLDHVYLAQAWRSVILVIPTDTSAIAARYWHINSATSASTASPNPNSVKYKQIAVMGVRSPGRKGSTHRIGMIIRARTWYESLVRAPENFRHCPSELTTQIFAK